MSEGLIPFVRVFPQQGTAETRVLTIFGHATLPTDEYGLLESYCPDPACNCRRVMLNVVGRNQRAILATISFAFDRDDEWAGPFLDPLNPQSAYAEDLFALVAQLLTDPAYVARLESHYYQLKGAAADPKHPAQQMLARRSTSPERPSPRRSKRSNRSRNRK
jgi:hypothetical protein